MNDTVLCSFRTLVAALLVLFLSLLSFSRASAAPVPVSARVIWTHAGRVYVAAADSLPLQEGDTLTFSDKKFAASAVVLGVYDRVLAIARVTSGSLESVKKLDRLRILAERPEVRPAPVLRVGFPARASLLFACEAGTLQPPASPVPYRTEALSPRSYRLVRDSSSVGNGSTWPDTLLVRMFDESTDEEIAIERGELDVAVFWPGELSTHMRGDPRWREFLYGTRPWGVLAAFLPGDPGGGFASSDSSTLLALDEEVFRGDLAPLPIASQLAARWVSRRFEVDHSCPGWETIERFLNRGKQPTPVPGEPSPVRLTLLDAPADSGAAHRASGILFAIRCPVVCAPDLRTYVRALGPDALVEMLDCRAKKGP